MRLLAFAFSIVALAGAAQAAAAPSDKVFAAARVYPAACIERYGKAAGAHKALLRIDVAKYGYIRNVRLIEATDDCIAESAVAFARGYRINGPTWMTLPQRGDRELEVTFERPAATQRRPIEFVAPEYPEGCQGTYRSLREFNVLAHIGSDGVPDAIEFAASDEGCAQPEIAKAVRQWRFGPAPDSVSPDVVQLQFLYESWVDSESSPVDQSTRRSVDTFYQQVSTVLIKEDDPAAALKMLADFESKESAALRRAEAPKFYLLRGVARLALNDLAKALDDLHAADQAALMVTEHRPANEVLLVLEAKFGVVDSTVRLRNAFRTSPLERIPQKN